MAVGQATASLRFDILARDKTRAALASVTNNLEGVSRSLDDVSNRAGLGRLSLFLGGLGALSVKVASDAEEMSSKFRAVFRDQADAVRAWSEELGEALNRSALDLQGYASQLQDTFVPLGFAREQATDLSKVITQLGVDLASFNNVAEPETIDLLTSALVGNHEAVRRFGVIITQATLEQELFRLGVEGGVRAATEQQKVLARLSILLASTSDAQGDAARTSDEFANRMRGLRGELRDALVLIGQEIMPTLSDMGEVVSDLVAWFSDLSAETRSNIVVFGGLVAAIAPSIAILGGITAAVIALATPMGALVVSLTALTFGFIVLKDEMAAFFGDLQAIMLGIASLASSGLGKLLPGALGDRFTEWGEALRLAARELASVTQESETLDEKVARLSETAGRYAATIIDQLFPSLQTQTGAQIKVNEAMTRHIDLLDQQAERIRASVETTGERVDRELDLLRVLEESGRISEEVATRRRLALFAEEDATLGLATTAETSAERMGTAFVRSADTAERAIVGFVRRGEIDLQSLLQTAADVASGIASAFGGGGRGGTGLISSLFGLFSGGGGGGGAAGGLGLSGAFSLGSALFGQHGARMVVAGGGGPDNQVVPVHASPGEEIMVNKAGRHQGGPRQEIHFHNDFRGAEAGVETIARQAVREEVGILRGQIVSDTLAAVEAENDAGGRFSSASGRRR